MALQMRATRICLCLLSSFSHARVWEWEYRYSGCSLQYSVVSPFGCPLTVKEDRECGWDKFDGFCLFLQSWIPEDLLTLCFSLPSSPTHAPTWTPPKLGRPQTITWDRRGHPDRIANDTVVSSRVSRGLGFYLPTGWCLGEPTYCWVEMRASCTWRVDDWPSIEFQTNLSSYSSFAI